MNLKTPPSAKLPPSFPPSPQPYLKHHNPRTFEDLEAPIPNFKKFGLKAGEVPKFFDSVLVKRADEAATKKAAWWEARRAVAKDAAAKASKVRRRPAGFRP